MALIAKLCPQNLHSKQPFKSSTNSQNKSFDLPIFQFPCTQKRLRERDEAINLEERKSKEKHCDGEVPIAYNLYHKMDINI